MIVVDLGLGRGAGGAGFGIVGVAHARGGVLGEDRLPDRPRFRGEVAGDGIIPSRRCCPCDSRVCGRVRCRRVRGRPDRAGTGSARRRRASSLGPTPAARPDQVASIWSAGGRVDEGREGGHRRADHLDVFGGDRPGARAAAVAGSTGASGSPIRCAAAPTRRPRAPAPSLGARQPPPDRVGRRSRTWPPTPRGGLGLQPGQHPVPSGWAVGRSGSAIRRPRRTTRGGQRIQVAAASASCAARIARPLLHRPSLTYIEHTFDHRQESPQCDYRNQSDTT